MHFFIGEPLFLSIAYGLNLETGKLASSDGFVAAAAIGQIGMFGTGIFNIVTMFFGGIGQNIWDVGSYFSAILRYS